MVDFVGKEVCGSVTMVIHVDNKRGCVCTTLPKPDESGLFHAVRLRLRTHHGRQIQRRRSVSTRPKANSKDDTM